MTMRNGTRVGLCTVVGTLVLLLSACAENNYYRHPHSGTKPLSPSLVSDTDAYANQDQPHVHGPDCGHVTRDGQWVSVDTE